MTALVTLGATLVTLLAAPSGAWAQSGSVWVAALVSVAILAGQSHPTVPIAAFGPLGIVVVAAAQAMTGTGGDAADVMAEASFWGTVAALMIAAAGLCAPETGRSALLKSFSAAAGLIAAFALVQPYLTHVGAHAAAADADTMVGPFRNRNTYASFVELAFPVSVWAARRYGPQWWLAAGALLASALTTGSRAGAAITMAEALILIAWMRQPKLAAALGSAALAGLLWGGSSLSTRLGYQDPLEHRREIYASSLELISQKPLLGWGLGRFQQVYPAQARFDVGKTVNHAHNDWLETAVEGGLPMAALMAASIAVLLWRARRVMWALGLSAVVVHSLVDFPFQRMSVAVWFFLMAGAAEAHCRSNRTGKMPNVRSLRQRMARNRTQREAAIPV